MCCSATSIITVVVVAIIVCVAHQRVPQVYNLNLDILNTLQGRVQSCSSTRRSTTGKNSMCERLEQEHEMLAISSTARVAR